MSELTKVLERARMGDAKASEELFTLVYEELRQLAAAKMARELPGQTLQATALVHEAWLRLGGDAQPAWQNRAHFFGAASEAMRRVLMDRARNKQREKRGGRWERIDLEHVNLAAEDADATVLAIDEALERFAVIDPVKAEVVKLRYFVGLNYAEIANALDLAEVTVRRYWALARAWLYADLKKERAAE